MSQGTDGGLLLGLIFLARNKFNSLSRFIRFKCRGTYLSREQIRANLERVDQNLSKKDPASVSDGRHDHYIIQKTNK